MLINLAVYAYGHGYIYKALQCDHLVFIVHLVANHPLMPSETQYLLLVLCNVQALIKMLFRVTC